MNSEICVLTKQERSWERSATRSYCVNIARSIQLKIYTTGLITRLHNCVVELTFNNNNIRFSPVFSSNRESSSLSFFPSFIFFFVHTRRSSFPLPVHLFLGIILSTLKDYKIKMNGWSFKRLEDQVRATLISTLNYSLVSLI